MSMRSWIRSLFTRPATRSMRKAPQRARLSLEALERREVLDASTQWLIGSGTYDLAQTFLLHSNPTAQHVVYLDFDGHTNGDVEDSNWDKIISPPYDHSGNGPSFTVAEMQTIQRVWAHVTEDFAPFNLDVTTEDPGVEALRKTSEPGDRWGIRVVFTPNDQPGPGFGGVAKIGSFNFDTDTPVYVFNDEGKGLLEAATHEVGHSLGLDHDGTSTLEYYGGHGSGTTSWGAIMGASFNPNVTQWSKGEYSDANNFEDDLAIITTNNGFTYRSDDFGDTAASAFSLVAQGSYVVNTTYGLIERNTDADYFSIWAGTGLLSLKVDPAPLSPNLAVRADLYDAAGNLLTTVNPANALNAVVDYVVTTPGQYFLKVSGTGKGNPLTTGFTNYASLGNYRITGSVSPPSTRVFTNDTNVNISTKPNITVTSGVAVAGLSGVVQDVNVRINLYHTWVSDLEITLIAPGGTRIQLFNRHGGSGDNLLNTIFDDSAATAISSGAAPFTGTFRPTQALAALIGKNPNGNWTLEVRDRVKGDGGYLDNWTLTLTTGPSGAA